MANKELIKEAINHMISENYDEMRENFIAVLDQKAVEKLDERKTEIAQSYISEKR